MNPEDSRTPFKRACRLMRIAICVWSAMAAIAVTSAQEAQPDADAATIVSLAGTVEILRKGTEEWILAKPKQTIRNGDQLRTAPKSRAKIRLSDKTIVPVRASTTITFEEPENEEDRTILNLNRGALFFRNRESPSRVPFKSRMAAGAIRGTEFFLMVEDDGAMTVAMLDGEVELTNEHGTATAVSGEKAIVQPGEAPDISPSLDTKALVQWVVYYPAVINIDDLGLNKATADELAESLAAYRSGDLKTALATFPQSIPSDEPRLQLFAGALLLTAGDFESLETMMSSAAFSDDEGAARLNDALQRLIDAVNSYGDLAPLPDGTNANASQWLADSYLRQSLGRLEDARTAAARATDLAPEFGAAWIRLAELHFSFGETAKAIDALDRGLELSPSNAQGRSLRGFLAAAENRIAKAAEHFEAAIELDGGLPTAWLGSGLSKIKRGDAEGGRRDLEIAAVVSPSQALFRNYLGKAYANEGDRDLARRELTLAGRLDPNDPTTWLYLSLLNQEANEINNAIRNLEESQRLNDNRYVYRSGLMLDQDRAVRSANLAGIYLDAGMTDVSVREATRAVNADYANYSAHLFLANAYNDLRDPRQRNLRYETPWFSEFLVANLLAPVGSGTLSQQVSQNEYSRLLEKDGFHGAASAEYYSNGDWIFDASQTATFGNSAYALDVAYRNDNGQQTNSDLEQLTVSLKFKQQLTSKDSVYIQGIYYDTEFGDTAQYFDPSNANADVRGEENQEPILIAGYHHEWQPGVHTLVLASRMHDEISITDPTSPILALVHDASGAISLINKTPATSGLDYRSEFEAYSAEAMQIWELDQHTLIFGGRFQTGEFETRSDMTQTTAFQLGNASQTAPFGFNAPASDVGVTADFERVSVYAYDNWQPIESLIFTAGLAYDHLTFPINHRNAPISAGDDSTDLVSPKVGVTWSPLENTVLRAAYTRSLGGVSFDQSFRLEPTQVAGFTQAYRSLVSESLVGSLTAPEFDTYGLAWDQKWETGTYLTIAAELLQSDFENQIGYFEGQGQPIPAFQPSATGTPLDLRYEEKNLHVILNQLVGSHWALGLRYRLTESRLDQNFSAIPASVSVEAESDSSALLQQATAYARYTRECGFFSHLESVWTHQKNMDDASALGSEDFWHVNAFIGHRFLRRHIELTAGVLNIFDKDYQLNPLTPYQEVYRDRTFMARLRMYF